MAGKTAHAVCGRNAGIAILPHPSRLAESFASITRRITIFGEETRATPRRAGRLPFRTADQMKYKVVLQKSDEGYSVSVPGLPGCWSQGDDEAEAIANISDAIREYLAARDELLSGADVREIDVAV